MLCSSMMFNEDLAKSWDTLIHTKAINTSILMELDSKYDQSGGLEGGSLVDGGMEQWQGAVKAATGLLDRIRPLW